MLRFMTSLALAGSCATAGLIATSQATCGNTTNRGTTSVICFYSYYINDVFTGYLTVSADGSITDQGNISGSALATDNGDRGTGSGSVQVTEDFVLTVAGGSGSGFFVGCFSGQSIPNGNGSAQVGGSLGGSGGISFIGSLDTCGSQLNFLGTREPFTFGVPQVLTATLSASVNQMFWRGPDDAYARVIWGSSTGDLLRLFDPAGNPITATYTLNPLVPEPSANCLVSLGLLCLVTIARKHL